MSDLVSRVLVVLINLALVPACLTAIYHLCLLVAGGLGRRNVVESSRPPTTRFALLIPAHDEEKVIGESVRRVIGQDYPSEYRDVYVVADHCSDETAAEARAAGAHVLERTGGLRGRKAYALAWGIRAIMSTTKRYDGMVVVDADSHIESTFLRAMDVALRSGKQVLQGQHVIRNPSHTAFARLADLDMRLNNLLRNQAKMPIGASARLMGDAMCFSASILARYGWPTQSVTEDREYGVFLVLEGERVCYTPGARSYGQAAPRWKDAAGQRKRWYAGVRRMRQSLRSRAFRALLSRPSVALLDQLLDLTLPSITSAAGLSALGLVVLISLPSPLFWEAFHLSAALCVFWVLFPLLGLLAARAPANTYLALVWAPYYLIWRLLISIRTQVAAGDAVWTRTRRHEEGL